MAINELGKFIISKIFGSGNAGSGSREKVGPGKINDISENNYVCSCFCAEQTRKRKAFHPCCRMLGETNLNVKPHPFYFFRLPFRKIVVALRFARENKKKFYPHPKIAFRFPAIDEGDHSIMDKNRKLAVCDCQGKFLKG